MAQKNFKKGSVVDSKTKKDFPKDGKTFRKPRQERKSGINDASWYNKIFGTYMPLETLNHITVQNAELSHASLEINQPDIMKLSWVPSFGVGTRSNDALNILAQQYYSWVRHWNSGSRNYEATDLMQVTVTIANAYIYVLYLTKIYGSLNVFSHVNYGFPEGLANALGVDWDDLVANQANLHAYINTLIYRLNAYTIPSEFDFVKRWFFMTEPLFMDDYYDSFKNQFITFNPEGLYIYDWERSQSLLISLQNVRDANGDNPIDDLDGFTYQNLVTIGDDLMRLISRYEDVGIICGDILKAFGEDSIYRLKPIDANYMVPIIKIENEFANEIRNAHVTNFIAMQFNEPMTEIPASEQLLPDDSWEISDRPECVSGSNLPDEYLRFNASNSGCSELEYTYGIIGQGTITQSGVNLVYNPIVVVGVAAGLKMSTTYAGTSNPYIGIGYSGTATPAVLLKGIYSQGRNINLIHPQASADEVLVATRFCPTYDMDPYFIDFQYGNTFGPSSMRPYIKYICMKLTSCDTMLLVDMNLYKGGSDITTYATDYFRGGLPAAHTIINLPVGPHFSKFYGAFGDRIGAISAPFQGIPLVVDNANIELAGPNVGVFGFTAMRLLAYNLISTYRLCPTIDLISYGFGTMYQLLSGSFVDGAVNAPYINTQSVGGSWVRVPMDWRTLEVANRNSVYSQLYVSKFHLLEK